MSRRTRRNHTPAFKAKVALAAVKGTPPVAAALSNEARGVENCPYGQ